MEDPDPNSSVDIEGYGRMCLKGGNNKENVRQTEAGIAREAEKGHIGHDKVL